MSTVNDPSNSFVDLWVRNLQMVFFFLLWLRLHMTMLLEQICIVHICRTLATIMCNLKCLSFCITYIPKATENLACTRGRNLGAVSYISAQLYEQSFNSFRAVLKVMANLQAFTFDHYTSDSFLRLIPAGTSLLSVLIFVLFSSTTLHIPPIRNFFLTCPSCCYPAWS